MAQGFFLLDASDTTNVDPALADRSGATAEWVIRGVLTVATAVVTLGVGTSCAPDDAALQVGDLAFSEEDLRGLGEAQTRTLARIAAVGLSVRADDPAHLGRPILEERRRLARIQRLREEVALERAAVDDDVLQAQYETRPEWELVIRHLVVLSERWRSDEHRDEARRTAASARERILEGEPFEAVAGEVSEEPGARERGGLLEPGREGAWVSEFWAAASALDEGEVSPVVETEYGFHVLTLEERRMVPFQEARARVASEVARQVADEKAWDRWVDDLLGDAAFYPERLPEGLADPPDPGSGEEDAPVLAEWNGETFTAARLAHVLSGRPAGQWQAFRDGTAETREALLREVAAAHFMGLEAERRGLEVPEPADARILREWERTVAGWAAFFGFEAGMPLDRTREAALQGLTGTGQNLTIARNEVNDWGPALDRAYLVQLPLED
jgi:hypothetical protein